MAIYKAPKMLWVPTSWGHYAHTGCGVSFRVYENERAEYRPEYVLEVLVGDPRRPNFAFGNRTIVSEYRAGCGLTNSKEEALQKMMDAAAHTFWLWAMNVIYDTGDRDVMREVGYVLVEDLEEEE